MQAEDRTSSAIEDEIDSTKRGGANQHANKEIIPNDWLQFLIKDIGSRKFSARATEAYDSYTL